MVLRNADRLDKRRAEDLAGSPGWDVLGVHRQPHRFQTVGASERQQQPATSRCVPMTTEPPFYLVSNLTGISQRPRRTDPQPNGPQSGDPAGMTHFELVGGHVLFDRISPHGAHEHQFQIPIHELPGLKESEVPFHLIPQERLQWAPAKPRSYIAEEKRKAAVIRRHLGVVTGDTKPGFAHQWAVV
jgi:hypothetical protein